MTRNLAKNDQPLVDLCPMAHEINLADNGNHCHFVPELFKGRRFFGEWESDGLD